MTDHLRPFLEEIASDSGTDQHRLDEIRATRDALEQTITKGGQT